MSKHKEERQNMTNSENLADSSHANQTPWQKYRERRAMKRVPICVDTAPLPLSPELLLICDTCGFVFQYLTSNRSENQ